MKLPFNMSIAFVTVLIVVEVGEYISKCKYGKHMWHKFKKKHIKSGPVAVQ